MFSQSHKLQLNDLIASIIKFITPLIIIPLSFSTLAATISQGQTVTIPFTNGAQNPDDPSSQNEWKVDGFIGNLINNGTLNILSENGVSGSVHAFTMTAGTQSGASGTVLISGPGSKLVNNSFLVLGNNGSGNMTVRDGGHVSNISTGQLGVNSGSDGFAHVTGPGSIWDSNSELLIGLAGQGAVQVSDEGRLSANRVTLARDSGSSGTVVIGALEGVAPVAPGIIEANRISAGTGTASLVLNHTSQDYVLDSKLNDGIDNAVGSGTGLVGNFVIDSLAGTTHLNSDHGDFTGTLQARENGTLSVNGDMSQATVSLLSGGVLEGNGRVGNTTNGGTISPGNSIGTLTIDGDYHGAGGTLVMESVLGGDNSPADRLIITGSATGDTHVEIVNLGGEGGFTENGIPLIYAAQLSDGNAFKLKGDFTTPEGEQAVVHGAYAYAFRTLQYGTGRWWYLTSDLSDPQQPVAPLPEVPTPGTPEPGTPTPGVPVVETPEPGVVTPGVPVFPVIPEGPDEIAPQRYHPGAALYEQYPQVLAELNRVPTLQERVGDIADDKKIGAWGRMEGNYSKNQPVASTTDADRKINLWKMQTGVDGAIVDNHNGLLTGGVNFSYGQVNADISAYSGSGDIDTTGYGPGLTLTWYGNNGLYVDSQVQMMFFNSDLNSSIVGTSLKSDNKGKGYAGSVESGWRLDAGNGYAITPQAQLVWSRVSFDSFDDTFGSRVSLKDGDSLLARLGVSGDHRAEWQAKDSTKTRSYVHVNLDVLQEMADGSTVKIEEVKFSSRDARTQIALGVGGTLDWNDGRYAVYGKVGVQASPHNPSDNYGAGGNVGIRISW
ncbi:fibronectin-binding autotransporter adhesin [Buttiauxella sp. BIGb0471]|uniref:autotransporter outer membrane beta-barrel domain-containing protein n=1 Tax=Buttiauxella sp. BIGb0471 TaxID=2940597 RepID=UPI00216926DA|nr:autotransporter outer membrane beta-barrel domain-containing protein [Buttiauxella sp. BIGb0471]MCS3601170.1 fibronectin-binding autotransporter adhesin [Buttiauxella sp. BIGb0471]